MTGLSALAGGRSIIARTGYRHGLGNRIRVVLGARILAELEDRQFFYVWPTGPEFGPLLTDLWSSREPTVSTLTSRVLSARYHYHDNTLAWLDESVRRQRLWQIRTSHALLLPTGTRPWQQDFRALRPVPPIADRVAEFFVRHLAGAPYVGVMIRAHSASHTKTLSASPIEWYLKRMREIRQEIPGIKFFVSCDVPGVQADVMAQLGNCVGLDDKGAYNTVAGIQAAVADLYLLGSAGYLLGPHYSSFVEMAQFLTGDGLTLETAMTARPATMAADLLALGLATDPTRPAERG